jgi:preprotein translocase subunit SecG
MGFIIGLFTFVMVLDCLILIFLVLLQLPKKDAGAGLAFGGAATDALFGAGSGTVLTKITKYAATCFFVLAFVLGIMQSRYSTRRGSQFQRMLEKPNASAPLIPGPAAPAATSSVPVVSSSNLLSVPSGGETNSASTTTNQ